MPETWPEGHPLHGHIPYDGDDDRPCPCAFCGIIRDIAEACECKPPAWQPCESCTAAWMAEREVMARLNMGRLKGRVLDEVDAILRGD